MYCLHTKAKYLYRMWLCNNAKQSLSQSVYLTGHTRYVAVSMMLQSKPINLFTHWLSYVLLLNDFSPWEKHLLEETLSFRNAITNRQNVSLFFLFFYLWTEQIPLLLAQFSEPLLVTEMKHVFPSITIYYRLHCRAI